MSNAVTELASRVIAELERFWCAHDTSRQFDPISDPKHREVLQREIEWNIKFGQIKHTDGVLSK